jgi:hypothetical protein
MLRLLIKQKFTEDQRPISGWLNDEKYTENLLSGLAGF